jgi:tetratricopeptide (TPR) repeat protein
LETRVGKLEHSEKDELLTIPTLLDEAQYLLAELSDKGGNWQSEETRLETITAQLKRKARTFVRKVGGKGALDDVRADHAPAEPAWWWRLDDLVREKKRQRFRKIGKWGLIAAAVLVVLGLAYRQFLAPSPEMIAALEHQQEAENLGYLGEYDAALKEVNQGLENLPDDAELLVLKGILLEVQDRSDEAEASFTQARRLTEDHVLFLQIRARLYLRLDLLDKAFVDAEVLTEQAPDDPVGYLYLAMIYDARDEWQLAVDHYEKASELAETSGEPQLYVMARSRLADLMQNPPLDITPTAE